MSQMTRKEFDALESHEERGQASGIPDCCIAFFVDIWWPLYGNWPQAMRDYSQKTAEWGYVPCPHCYKTGNRVQIVWHGNPVRDAA